MKTISNTEMKNGGPVVAVPDFQPDHRPFGGCDGAVLRPEVARHPFTEQPQGGPHCESLPTDISHGTMKMSFANLAGNRLNK